MNCSDFQRRVPSYPDRSLPAADKAALDQHATVCPLCAPALKVFRAMREGLGALPSIGASDEFERRVLRRVSREREEGGGRVIEFPAWGRPVALAIAAGLLLFVGWQAMWRDSGGVRREVAVESPARADEALTVAGRSEASRDPSASDVSRANPTSDSPVALTTREPRTSRSETLDMLLDQGGISLAPPGSGRTYVIDRPTDLPRLLSEGAEGELASTPITF